MSFRFPSGNGVRVDTSLINGHATTVTSDFDSLIAKLIITAPSWDAVVRKAKRALQDTTIAGVQTNLDMLRAIVAHPDFATGDCSTTWLEAHQQDLVAMSTAAKTTQATRRLPILDGSPSQPDSTTSLAAPSAPVFRKGDAWSLQLAPKKSAEQSEAVVHHLQLTKLLRNDFPTSLSADILYTTQGSQPLPYTLTFTATTSSATAATSSARKGDRRNPTHIINPFPGRLVELLVDVGDSVKKDDVIAVVRQMKMELEVRSTNSGVVSWATEVQDGDEIGEGILLAVIEQKVAGIASISSKL